MSSFTPHLAYPSPPPQQVHRRPIPPRLHWAWVLLLGIVTLGLFFEVWMIVQAAWTKKVLRKPIALYLAIGYLFFTACIFIASVFGTYAAPASALSGTALLLRTLVRFGGAALYLAAIFSLRGELEEATGLSLSGGMTFFFGSLYFQYHLRDYGRAAT